MNRGSSTVRPLLRRVGLVFASVALIGTGCSQSVDEALTVPGTTASDGIGATTISGVGTSSAPADVGPSSRFTYKSPISDVVWDGTILGMVPGSLSPGSDKQGSCLTILGTLTAISDSGNVMAAAIDAPVISLIGDDGTVDAELFACETAAVEEAGFGSLIDATVTKGTTYAFHEAFVVESVSEIDAVRVGDGRGESYYLPTLIDAVPYAANEGGPELATRFDLLSIGPDSDFEYADPYSDNTWTGSLLGAVSIPTNSAAMVDGACLVLVGTISPTFIDGGTVADGFFAPKVSLVANGVQVDEAALECDADAVEAAGYGALFRVDAAVDEHYPFFVEIFVESDFTAVEAVVLGNPRFPGALMYELDLLSTLPVP